MISDLLILLVYYPWILEKVRRSALRRWAHSPSTIRAISSREFRRESGSRATGMPFAHDAEVEGSSPSLTTKSMGYDCSSLAFSGILRDCGAQI